MTTASPSPSPPATAAASPPVSNNATANGKNGVTKSAWGHKSPLLKDPSPVSNTDDFPLLGSPPQAAAGQQSNSKQVAPANNASTSSHSPSSRARPFMTNNNHSNNRRQQSSASNSPTIPLNSIRWTSNSNNASPYLAGQQRTLSNKPQYLWKQPSAIPQVRSLQFSQSLPLHSPTSSQGHFNVAAYAAGYDLMSPALSSDGSSSNYSPLLSTDSLSMRSPQLPYDSMINPYNNTTPTLVDYTPGPGIRRLAEQFLSSLPDDSPSTRVRNLTQSSDSGQSSIDSSVNVAFEQLKFKSDAAASPVQPTQPLTGEARWQSLHDDIMAFARHCETEQEHQSRMRDELVARTRWAINTVWPTAIVDLVGSVGAKTALAKSDLDFVIHFPLSVEKPISYSHTTPTNSPSAPHTRLNNTSTAPPTAHPAGIQQQGSQWNIQPPNTAYTEVECPFFSAEAEPSADAPTTTTSDGAKPKHWFSHAGNLLKLIGGRKKSKLLFRSTKIQVFKDINLIRLRDGYSGVSLDLWFPVDAVTCNRSQRHAESIKHCLQQFPSFYPLSCLIKTFMQQNQLNSGYSGLSAFGVLLMIQRFLQHQRQQATEQGAAEESNIGKQLYSFFQYYVDFDYVNKAISVAGEGATIDKPAYEQLNASFDTGAGQASGNGDDDGHARNDSDSVHEADNEQDDDAAANDTTTPVKANDGQAAPINNSGGRDKLKKRALGDNKFTLVIMDPMDDNNQIICHHKALRNIVVAFSKACSILDPTQPPPELPTALTSQTATQAPVPGQVGEPSIQQFVQQFKLATTQSQAASYNGTDTSIRPFYHLIDIAAATAGPQLKPCLSSQCTNPDGTPANYVPIQNKVCFQCGYLFAQQQPGAPTQQLNGHQQRQQPQMNGMSRRGGQQHSNGRAQSYDQRSVGSNYVRPIGGLQPAVTQQNGRQRHAARGGMTRGASQHYYNAAQHQPAQRNSQPLVQYPAAVYQNQYQQQVPQLQQQQQRYAAQTALNNGNAPYSVQPLDPMQMQYLLQQNQALAPGIGIGGNPNITPNVMMMSLPNGQQQLCYIQPLAQGMYQQ